MSELLFVISGIFGLISLGFYVLSWLERRMRE
jgi:hypothetical protein